jgi:hypothetical protein
MVLPNLRKAVTIPPEAGMSEATKRLFISCGVILLVVSLCLSLVLVGGAITLALGW